MIYVNNKKIYVHAQNQRSCVVYTNCIKKFHLDLRNNFKNLVHMSCTNSIYMKILEGMLSMDPDAFFTSDSGLGAILYLD